MVVVGILADQRLEASIVPAERARFGADNERVASELAARLGGIRADVRAVLGSAAVQGVVRAQESGGVDPRDGTPGELWRERLASLLMADLETRPSHLQFRLIGLADGGRELVRVDRSGPGGSVRVVPAGELQRKGGRSYVSRAVERAPGDVYISQIELNREHGKVELPPLPVVRAATPVVAAGGEIFGLMVLNVDMRPALERIRSADSRGHHYVLSEAGDYLVHPEPNEEFGSELGRPAQWRSDFPEVARAIGAADSVALELELRGRRYVAAATAVRVAGGPRIIVLETAPYAQIVAPARLVRRSMALAGSGAVLLGALLSGLLARSLTRPLARMTSAVASFTGSEPVEVPVTTRDEIGVLARAFERMTRDIVEVEEVFRLAVESAPNGMIIVDSAGRILLVNAQIEAMFRYDREALLGQPLEILVPERVRTAHEAFRAKYSRTPETRAMGANRELFGCRKDGSEFPLEIGLSPFTTSHGARVLATVVDIGPRKRSAERLRSYAKNLERSNADLEEFAYVASHDLKAPLRGISSVAHWLSEDFQSVVTPDQKENLDLMLERTERLNDLIDGILAYSRVGRQPLSLEPVDAHAVASQVLDDLVPSAGIDVRIEGALPSVVCDQTQLRQLFQNLIVNAVRHMGRPTGEVVVSCERGEREWWFEVRDTGVGIPERHLERIFGLFQTLQPKDEIHTTGVGLSIVKRIVESAGGTIQARSSPGKGSSFRFSIPDSELGEGVTTDEELGP